MDRHGMMVSRTWEREVERCRKIAIRKLDHGCSIAPVGSPEYRTWYIWISMRQRCENEDNSDYPKYGGRGIFVEDRWFDFNEFVADMGYDPNKMSLDRVDNNGPYSKANCRWATRKQQNNNRRSNRILLVCDTIMTLAEFCEKYHIGKSTARVRLGDRDMLSARELEEVLAFTPAIRKKPHMLFEIAGQNRTLADWAELSGVEIGTIHKRISKLRIKGQLIDSSVLKPVSY